MVKRGEIYHLHVKVPEELAPVLGGSDLSVSLGPHKYREAYRRKLSAYVRFETTFQKIRSKRWES